MRRSDGVFFLSGAAALAYEAIWARLLARLLGADASGLAVVLAVFMAGLGLGAWLFAGPARRARDPRRLFLLIELGLAAWAAATPLFLDLLEPVVSLAARAAVAAGVLFVPTLLMGATFPVMGRLTIRRREDTGTETSAFYGANTLGGAVGALAGPLLLTPWLGFHGALIAAALLDVLAGVLALGLDEAPPRESDGREEHGDAREDEEPLARPRGGAAPLLAAAFLLGAASLALEVLLQRLLITVTGASVYALALVLAVYLGGLGLGSRLTAQRADQRLRAGPRTLFLAAACAPLLALAGLCALRWQLGESDLFGHLANRMPSGASIPVLWASHVLFAALALLPAGLAFGVALPSVVASLARGGAVATERLLSRAYAANTLGALTGALAAAFVLLPSLGLRAAVAVALVPCLVAAGLVLSALAARAGRARELVAALAVALALGYFALRPAPSPEGHVVLAHAFGPHATVGVEEDRSDPVHPVRSLRVNGKVVATTAPVDLRLQRLLAHVPALLHGEVERALVIGLGTGMTAGALLDWPTVRELEVIEISAAVIPGARQFAAWNADLLDDPRTELVLRDGRHAARTTSERYDLVTADPIHPWTRGSSDLYAVEHFEALAGLLEGGGVASQWLPLYQLSTEDVRTVIASWCAAFPHTGAWLSAYDLVLVGAAAPFPAPEELAARPLPPRVDRALAEAGVHSAAELMALWVADDEALRAYVDGVAPMRESRPVLEFRAPLSYLSGYSVEVLRWAGREPFVEHLPAASRERGREVRAALGRFLEALPGGLSRAAETYGRELMALPPLAPH